MCLLSEVPLYMKVSIWCIETCPLFGDYFYCVPYSECLLSEIPLYSNVRILDHVCMHIIIHLLGPNLRAQLKLCLCLGYLAMQ